MFKLLFLAAVLAFAAAAPATLLATPVGSPLAAAYIAPARTHLYGAPALAYSHFGVPAAAYAAAYAAPLPYAKYY